MADSETTREILRNRYSGGPHNLGDPEDTFLRKVEIDVMIPKKMREIARVEKCVEEADKFTKCCKDNNILMSFKCRTENDTLKNCLTKWYEDDDFKERCKNEYLEERREYRRTGITQKQKQRVANSM